MKVTGNLKVDSVSQSPPTKEAKQKLKSEFGFSEKSFVLVGVSTWPGEEEALLQSIGELRKEKCDACLLLIPRHAERREEIRKLISASGLPFALRSESRRADSGTVVYLADTTGELPKLIGAGDIAFLGKTLPPNNGGQNPMEPVSIGLPLVVGPAYQNFRESCAELFSHGAAFKAQKKEEAQELISEFAGNAKKKPRPEMPASNGSESKDPPLGRPENHPRDFGKEGSLLDSPFANHDALTEIPAKPILHHVDETSFSTKNDKPIVVALPFSFFLL